ncbi:helix-turn-helix transcriptional regulator [Dinghuibacter silviterrae]|uniref:Helix-turn-helix protein n=1 Tax=Dinghuibacter silviterrae TaxID=1539049 RepID=A0A4V3GM59_9BACT|nr:helix-turn-helix transcriptional regulator [Dinghuibacter silviterrae]TDX02193.1 helix-turn-helix protein [Dinghuibacter silviterrae]
MGTTEKLNGIHEGRNVKRFREMLGMKQDALASALGEDWTQRRVSLLEQKESIEPEVLEQVAQVLKVPIDAIKNFDEAAAINIISSTLHDNAGSINNHCTLSFDPVDKWLEAMEEIKKLYERLLESEKQKVEILQNQLTGRKQ